MMGMLIQAILTSSVDTEGDLPEEMTASLKLRIDIDGRPPVVLNDIFSGASLAGNRAPQALFTQVGVLLNQMNFNPMADLKNNKIECVTEIVAVRHGGRVYFLTGTFPADDGTAREQVRQAVASAVWQGAEAVAAR